jgi:hypothetical protein
LKIIWERLNRQHLTKIEIPPFHRPNITTPLSLVSLYTKPPIPHTLQSPGNIKAERPKQNIARLVSKIPQTKKTANRRQSFKPKNPQSYAKTENTQRPRERSPSLCCRCKKQNPSRPSSTATLRPQILHKLVHPKISLISSPTQASHSNHTLVIHSPYHQASDRHALPYPLDPRHRSSPAHTARS